MSTIEQDHEERQAHAKKRKSAFKRLTEVPREDLNRLLALRHADPHSILGAHIIPAGVVVRTYRPNAEKVLLLEDGQEPLEMTERPEAGIFEIVVAGRRATFPYQLSVSYPGGSQFTLRSSYSFLPSLGELDLYLLREQKHERAYDKLGAHVHEMDGIAGVAFAVWAPNASGVSVVGDFNGWDGRLHMMRMLGSSGIWESFVPDIQPGTRYKY
ncbi:MAG TPA: hypothetical protein VGR40_10600, partial [Candidatus Binatus sp.]|nr:hypothetical protein [Candidatus Binatus sp.]